MQSMTENTVAVKFSKFPFSMAVAGLGRKLPGFAGGLWMWSMAMVISQMIAIAFMVELIVIIETIK